MAKRKGKGPAGGMDTTKPGGKVKGLGGMNNNKAAKVISGGNHRGKVAEGSSSGTTGKVSTRHPYPDGMA